MVAIHETAYPRILSNTPQRDIKRLYTPTKAEWLWVKKRKVDDNSQLGNMVLLKCFQRLGYFPKLDTLPNNIVDHIAEHLDIEPPFKPNLLFSSAKSTNRAKHAIRQYRNVKKVETLKQKTWLTDFSLEMAETKDNVVDIINAMIEILLKERFELPGFTTLEKIASSSRATINKVIVKKVSSTLSVAAKNTLQSLLEETNDEGISLWQQLKQEPKRPTSRTLKEFLTHSQWINEIQREIGPLPEIPEEKRQQLVIEAKAYDIDRMQAIAKYKRFTLLALLVNEQFYFSTDCIVDMFIKEVRKLHNRGKIELKQFQNGAIKESETLIILLKDVANIMTDDDGQSDKIQRIDTAFEHDSPKIVKRCDQLVLHGFDNYLQFLEKCYSGCVFRRS